MNNQTLRGVLAILFWSTTVAFSRQVTGALGTWTGSALIYTSAGALAIALAALTPGRIQAMLRLPRKYLFGCGGLFTLYMVCLYLAIGAAATPAQVVVVGLINYLWPGLSLAFSVPLLRKKARPFLPVGILTALAGIILASWQPGANLGSSLGSSLGGSLLAGTGAQYLLALVAAVSWGLYSVLSRVWAGDHSEGAVPFFLLTSGLALALGRVFHPETSTWSLPVALTLIYMIIFPAMLAYSFWESAMRRGRIILVAALSNFTPLISTVISVTVLKAPAPAALWLGALLVFAGAAISKFSIPE